MAIYKLLKAREATTVRAEDYKSAIRKYMEASGYAQTTDSIVEGHPPDMIFYPRLENRFLGETWVEAKATQLSLSNGRFVAEVIGYLRQWLARTPARKFALMIFAEQIVNPTRWERLWGSTLSQDEIVQWLKSAEGEEVIELVKETNLKDTISFFSETSIVVGTISDLLESAAAKKRIGMNAAEIRRHARELLSKMEERSWPIPLRSELTSNLLQLFPPMDFVILDIDPLPFNEVRSLMRNRESPPFTLPVKGKLITLNVTESEIRFSVLNPVGSETVEVQEMERRFPRALASLVNTAIREKLRPLGIREWNGWSYFLAEREAKGEIIRTIQTSSGETMQVARPLYRLDASKEDLTNDKQLNFVFHQAFRARYRTLWGQHFVELRLKRLYTSDGSTVIEGRAASRIDAKFRNPMYNRSETQQRKVHKLGEFLFQSKTQPSWKWMDAFQFGDFLGMKTDWTPDSVPLDQTLIEEYDEAVNDDDLD